MVQHPVSSETPRPARDAVAALSVVIPVHNEADNIGALLDEVGVVLASLAGPAELVVVDDGSTDATREVLAQAASEHRNLIVVCHAANRGQSAALLSGVRAARAPWIVTLDGDGQNDPADLARLLEERGPAVGARGRLITGHRTRRRDSRLRRLSSRIANAVRGALLRDPTPDTGCGLKLFERDVFLSLPHFDHFHRFLPALVRRAGGTVTSVEVSHRPRTSGISHYGVHDRLWVGLADLLGVLWLGRRVRPWALESFPAEGSAEAERMDDGS